MREGTPEIKVRCEPASGRPLDRLATEYMTSATSSFVRLVPPLAEARVKSRVGAWGVKKKNPGSRVNATRAGVHFVREWAIKDLNL